MSTQFTCNKYTGPMDRRCTRRVPDKKKEGKERKCPNKVKFDVKIGDFGFSGEVCHLCVQDLFTAYVNRQGI